MTDPVDALGLGIDGLEGPLSRAADQMRSAHESVGYPLPAEEALRVIRPAWHSNAACRALEDRTLFFSDDPGDQDSAKKICDDCTVQGPCLAWALDNRESGVWGGTTDEDRLKGTKNLSFRIRLYLSSSQAV